ncbi:MAG TPA: fused MFS/spermidine synthase, partial [Verrucomicrobiae bacterium]|nr:fused MFS/spermidine synthase [Verrucomicrobiae bacterium]
MNQSPTPNARRFALWGLFFLSGAAALGYQVLWAKMFALRQGHEFPAVVTVICAIFIGMAIGGILANRILARLGGHAFAKLEFLIGVFGLLTPLLIVKLNLGSFASIAILPSAIAMGATLPAMAQLASIPSAYAANTLGAVVGCLGTAFFLMPKLGLITPIYLYAAANFVAAFLARGLVPTQKTDLKHFSPALASLFFLTGFIGLGFEAFGVRLLSLSLENTVFTFAAILAVYLLGQAIGAAVIRLRPTLTAILLVLTLGISIWFLTKSSSVYESLREGFGDSGVAVFAAELLTALAVFALPTLFMGGLFTQLAKGAGQGGLGRSLFWNSLGGALGAALVPMLLLPNIPPFKSLIRVPPGSTLREVRVGRMATVAVTESPDGHRTLFVNNRFQMGGTAASIPELRHAHIPLLLHRAPESALVLGLGTGITLSACAVHPNLNAEGVELLPEVIGVMPHFFPSPADSPLRAANITVHAADARKFIRETTNNYDVIIADLFHPAQDGAAFLYTREHFQHIRARLATNGLFCQWLPLHQLDLQTFRDITRTFLAVFPNAEAWLLRPNIDAPVVGLIGYKSKHAFNAGLVDSRLTNPALAAQLRRVALTEPVRLFGSFLSGPESLRGFANRGRMNTDTFPIVMFEAPAFSYRHNSPTHQRLIAFLREIGLSTPPIVDTNLHAKVTRYIQARDTYLNALV